MFPLFRAIQIIYLRLFDHENKDSIEDHCPLSISYWLHFFRLIIRLAASTKKTKKNCLFDILFLKKKSCLFFLEMTELLLEENKYRFTLFPILHKPIFHMYKKQEASFWTVEEVDLAQDQKDWDKLNSNEQHFLKHVLAFFAAS